MDTMYDKIKIILIGDAINKFLIIFLIMIVNQEI